MQEAWYVPQVNGLIMDWCGVFEIVLLAFYVMNGENVTGVSQKTIYEYFFFRNFRDYLQALVFR